MLYLGFIEVLVLQGAGSATSSWSPLAPWHSIHAPVSQALLRHRSPSFSRSAFAPPQVFVRHYRDQGWHVVKDPTGGFLLRQRSAGPGAPAMCVHGGTTATLVAVLDGRLMVIANCGDSSAVMCGASPDTFPLQPIDTWPREEAVAGESGLEAMGLEAVLPDVGGVVGAAVGGAGAGGGEGSSASTSPSLDSSAVPDGCEACVAASPKLLAAGWEMSADHGPENPGEYERMRASHPSKADRAGLSP